MLLAVISILLCFFFLFLVIFSNLVIILVVKENIKSKREIAIHTGTPITLAEETIDIPPLAADNANKVLSKFTHCFFL